MPDSLHLSITQDRLVVLDIVINNREKHRKEHMEGVSGYHVALRKALIERLEEIDKAESDKGDKLKYVSSYLDRSNTLHVESHHIAEYDIAIEMLRASTDELIRLTMNDYNKLVKDQWDWRSGYDISMSKYK